MAKKCKERKQERQSALPSLFHACALLFLLLSLAAGTFFGCASESKERIPEKEEAPRIGYFAPSFTLPNLAGEARTLEDYKGKALIINFWTTWCRYCLEEMPLLEELHGSGEDIIILAVNVKEKKEEVDSFIRKMDYNFPVLLDLEGEVAAVYQVRGLPTTFAVDAGGVITGIRVGAFDAAGLAALVESALK